MADDCTFRIRDRWTVLSALLALTGCAVFLIAISGSHVVRAWQAYLVNFVFWTGLSFGAVLFSAVLNLTNATWGRPLKRMGEAFAAYLPASFVLYWALYFGRQELYHWVHTPPNEGFKQVWLTVPFMFARNGVALLVLTGLSILLVYYSVAEDRRFMADRDRSAETGGGTGWRMQKVLSPVIAIVYAFVLSLVAFDLIMSLDERWYSTLYGGYYFAGSFYSAVAALYLMSLIALNQPALRAYLHPRQFHDMGKLLMAFCLFTGYLFYAQFLVIWYGNIPEETRYMILRYRLPPWEYLGYAVLLLSLFIPFFILLSRKVKTKRVPMMILTVMILIGVWLDRFIMVVPSVSGPASIPLGALELAITAGFFGIVALCVILFLRRVPALPVSDPLFHKFIAEREERLRP